MKSLSKPVLLAFSLPLILAALPSCTRAKYTPPKSVQAGATQNASVSALNGYWIEQTVPAGEVDSYRGHAMKPTSISIQDGKLFDLVKYSDSSIDQFPVGITASEQADPDGSWTIRGDGFVVTIFDHGSQMVIHDVQTFNGITSVSDVVYVKTDSDTAQQHARPLWFKKTPSYRFTKQYCEVANKLDFNAAAMVRQIDKFASDDAARQGTTIGQIRTQRNSSGGSVTSCQITEDYLERGIEFAKTGITPVYPELVNRPTLTVSVDAKSDLAPLLALELDDLALQSGDKGASTFDLSPLLAISGLESLSLEGLRVSGLDKLSALSGLKDLTLIGMDLPDYATLGKLPGLLGLKIQGDFSAAKALPVISSLTQLDHLLLDNRANTTQKLDLSPLEALSNLLNFQIYGDFFTNLNFLPHLGNLTTLGVTLENDDSVDMIASLATITNLKHVTIQKTVTKSDDMKFVSKIPNIQELKLTLGSAFSDLSMITEKNCPDLQSLELAGASKEPGQALPDLSSAIKIPGLNKIAASGLLLSDLTMFEGFLKANKNAMVNLDSDQAQANQKNEDQTLQKEFGLRYYSSLIFK